MHPSHNPIFFFLYGCQKTATTWLYKNLNQSEQFYDGGLKEWRFWKLYFSNKLQVKKKFGFGGAAKKYIVVDAVPRRKLKPDEVIRRVNYADPDQFIERVTSQVLENPDCRVLGDCSPSIGRVIGSEGRAKLIDLMGGLGFRPKSLWIIRDPLTRSLSLLRMALTNGRFGQGELEKVRKDQGHLTKIIRENLQFIVRESQYDLGWEEFHNMQVPTKLIHFEDLFKQAKFDEITQFLEMDNLKIIPEKVNAGSSFPISSENKKIIAKELQATYSFFQSLYGEEELPASWIESLEYL